MKNKVVALVFMITLLLTTALGISQINAAKSQTSLSEQQAMKKLDRALTPDQKIPTAVP